MFWTMEKLAARIDELAEYRYRDPKPIPDFGFLPDVRGNIGERPPQSGEWQPIRVGERWSGYDSYAWLSATADIPAEWKGRKIVGRFAFGRTGVSNISGFESLLYVNDIPYQGVDTHHQEVLLPDDAAGASVRLCFRIWSGLFHHEPILLNDWEQLGPLRRTFYEQPGQSPLRTVQEHTLSMAQIAWLDEETDDLYYLGKAALETAQVLEPHQPDRHALLSALDRAFVALDWSRPGSPRFYASVREARRILRERLSRIERRHPVQVTCIGHTHIDVAWLWQLKHTREKSARSFSTVLNLMDHYPEYIFLQTQPQLYEYIKTDYPDIYERMKSRIAEKRWEASGGMWLEADCNLTSGESLVRQILFGTRFLREQFGAECTYLWLPDVFGYSPALPQILKKSGIGSFMTTKINMMSQYNPMPHHTFQWVGMDGSEVLAHFAGYTYNGILNAAAIHRLWGTYKDQELNRNLLFVYGYGDGGGGVNRDMLEMRRRLDELPGMPRVEPGRADAYFADLQRTVAESGSYVHRWEGELYFEYHRGTYTSQAFVKRLNRKCELSLRETEWMSVLHGLHRGDWALYDAASLREAWKIVLRNQFHDIIPGSSIREVYEDCRSEYAEAGRLIRQTRDRAARGIAGESADRKGRRCLTVFNGSPWPRTDLLRIPADLSAEEGVWADAEGRTLPMQRSGEDWIVLVDNLPPLGWTTLEFVPAASPPGTPDTLSSPAFQAFDTGIATPHYVIEWNDSGQLVSIYDRAEEREVLAHGERGNVLQVFEDKPLAHDAWDIDIFYREKMREVDALSETAVEELGPLRAVVRFAWIYNESVIRQNMVVYAHSRRIDFETSVDWRERQQLLKTAFPVSIRAAEATFDMQFGNVKRPTHWNTSWDYARFESVGHQWADVSEYGYGVSLLNDCKYGYDIHRHVLRLSLLRSPVYPDYAADQGEHAFTYSLFPHREHWTRGGTVEAAWHLNNPPTYERGGANPPRFSLLRASSDTLMVDAVKKAEDSNGVIVRIHEFAGGRGPFELTCGFPVRFWQECDLMERPVGEATPEPVIRSTIGPYEIKTFMLTF